jgi:hypothetical protein
MESRTRQQEDQLSHELLEAPELWRRQEQDEMSKEVTEEQDVVTEVEVWTGRESSQAPQASMGKPLQMSACNYQTPSENSDKLSQHSLVYGSNRLLLESYW